MNFISSHTDLIIFICGLIFVGIGFYFGYLSSAARYGRLVNALYLKIENTHEKIYSLHQEAKNV